MRRYSITTKITIIFAIAFSLVLALIITFYKIEQERALDKVRDRQINAINYLLALYERANPPQDLSHYFRNFGLEYVSNNNLISSIVSDGEILFARQTPLGVVQSIVYKNELYLQIKNTSFQIMLQSNESKNVNDPFFVGFFAFTVLLIWLYVSVLRSLMPLKKLSMGIRKFASGNIDIQLANIKQNDEIGVVAGEFNNAVKKIRELIRSRQLFLRAIMHELKTPIGKGRIVSEMVANDTQKTRLISVFERLDLLINEFGKIEQLLSKSYSLEYQECHFSLILEQVIDMLMLENFNDRVRCEIIDDKILRVDFQLFSLAIKNLIDNALKYADDKKVILVCKDDKISIKNKGEALQHDISHYKQAFIRGDDGVKKSSGMGLGLYIIEQICDMHKFGFAYEYIDGYHCFDIITNKN
ncbi:hypothetical protein LMG7974_00111 [Campylobacter majalis]|uniref:histidine kinase n=1 Tax=Campylobacter majalis TaxID=2790656 RepID=A0ABM8Q1W9_9BACT|nr:ArsS family sensor histidine kinase [Campylobacter majalis]CAD7286842.1 hypothetical protein LMG7974_00111 [Campylobacter majalis]